MGPVRASGFIKPAIVGVLLSIVAFGLLLAVGSWFAGQETLKLITSVSATTILLMLCLSLCNYTARALRWHGCSRRMNIAVPIRRNFQYYFAGFALTMTPGKIGEAFRLYLLYRNHNCPIFRTTALLLIDRFGDAVALLILCMFGLHYFMGHGLLVLGAFVLLALPMAVVIAPNLFVRVLNRAGKLLGIRGRFLNLIYEIVQQIRQVSDWRMLLTALGLGILGWMAEALAFYLALKEFGAALPLMACAFIFAASALAGALFLVPGGLGGTEASMVGLLLLGGVDIDVAIGATALIRLTTLWFATALGFALLPAALRKEPGAPSPLGFAEPGSALAVEARVANELPFTSRPVTKTFDH